MEVMKENEAIPEPILEFVDRIRIEQWMANLPAGKIAFLYDTRKDKVAMVLGQNTRLSLTQDLAEILGFHDTHLFRNTQSDPQYVAATRPAHIQQFTSSLCVL